MRSELLSLRKNKVACFSLISLLLLFVIYTISVLLSVKAIVIDYAAARMTYDFSANQKPDSFSALYFWYGTTGPYKLPSSWFSFFETILDLLLIPIFLGMAFVDSFVQDYNSRVTDILITREGKWRYYRNKFTLSFMGPFLTMFILLIIQFLFGILMLRLIPTGFRSPNIGLEEVGIVLLTSLRISIYNGAIITFSYALSLILKRKKALTYAYPVILGLLFTMVFMPAPFNMAFAYSNLIRNDYRIFWGSIIAMLLSALCVQLCALQEKWSL